MDKELADNASTRITTPEPAPTDTQAVGPALDSPTQVHPGAPAPLGTGALSGSQHLLRAAEGPGEIGRLGPYRILEVLGAGGMGFVYRAEDVHLQRPVALKVLKPHLTHEEGSRQRFLREARAAAQLKNDHVVTIYQVGEDQGTPYLAMEYLEGEGLDHWLQRGGKPTLADVLRIGREIAVGLDAAHRRGLIHRDVKPANVWLEKRAENRGSRIEDRGSKLDQGIGPLDRSSILDPRSSPPRVKLLDFGLARAISEDVRLTQTGTILGTPSYMSPEQARGEDIDHRSDLFSLGCVLYRLCTGELPFRGETTIAILTALAVDTPRPVREINATVPPQLGGLISRLLAKNPDDRPGSAAEVIAAIEAIERGSISVAWKAPAAEVSPTDPTRRLGVETYVPGGPVAQAAPTPAPTNPLLEELLRRARHNRRMMWIKVLLFLVVLGALGLFFGPLAYRYATDQGQIVIPGGDADTEILIRKGGAEVGRGRGRSMTWKAGTWEVEVRSRGQWMGEERVTLKRGGTVTIGPPAGP